MLNILEGYSKNFRVFIHELLNVVMLFFIDVGSNLDYSEIYAIIFPSHLQENEEFIKEQIYKLYRFITDDYSHNLSSLDEYTLYGALFFVYEGSEDGFILSDLVEKKLNEISIECEDEKELLKAISDVYDLIGICFEDVDFLDVPLFIEFYKNKPDLLEKLHVDLDFYTDIMPPDILKEYESLKESRIKEIKLSSVIDSKVEFFEIVKNSIYAFNTDITQNKLHEVLNGPTGTAGEKIVQRLYYAIAQRDLKNFNILIHQEVDTNRGVVDFNLSIGSKYQALIEFKLGNSSHKDSGIKYQLPLYMIKEDIDFGIFVLICYSNKIYEEAKKYYEIAKVQSEKYNKNILFLRINASGNYRTASKIKCEEEMGLEDWRYFS